MLKRAVRRAALVLASAVVAFPLALDHLGLKPQSQLIVSLARWPLMFIILLVALIGGWFRAHRVTRLRSAPLCDVRIQRLPDRAHPS